MIIDAVTTPTTEKMWLAVSFLHGGTCKIIILVLPRLCFMHLKPIGDFVSGDYLETRKMLTGLMPMDRQTAER